MVNLEAIRRKNGNVMLPAQTRSLIKDYNIKLRLKNGLMKLV